MDAITQDLLHCKICIRVLYEPFINPCGHTYCYSCLAQWFENNSEGRRVTCPECRTHIETPPAPNYLVRQLVHKLIQQPYFTEDGETPESHKRARDEESRLVERDRASPLGLFKGRFTSLMASSRITRIHDVEDGVERCPHCAWEIEEDSDVCQHCGIPLDESFSDEDGVHPAALADDLGFDSAMDEDDDQYLEEVDAEFDLDVDLSEQLGLPGRGASGLPASRRGFVPARSLAHAPLAGDENYPVLLDSEASSDTGMGYAEDDHEGEPEEDEDEDGDDDTSMDGFIDDEDSDSDTASGSSSSPPPESETADDEDADEDESDDAEPSRNAEIVTPVNSSTAEQRQDASKRRMRTRPVVIESSDDESEEEGGGPIRNRRFHRATRVRAAG